METSQVKRDLFEISKTILGYSNFSKEEWQSLHSLADDRSIVIKKADEGSCVKMTEKQLKYFTIAHKKATNLEKMYLLPKKTF